MDWVDANERVLRTVLSWETNILSGRRRAVLYVHEKSTRTATEFDHVMNIILLMRTLTLPYQYGLSQALDLPGWWHCGSEGIDFNDSNDGFS